MWAQLVKRMKRCKNGNEKKTFPIAIVFQVKSMNEWWIGRVFNRILNKSPVSFLHTKPFFVRLLPSVDFCHLCARVFSYASFISLNSNSIPVKFKLKWIFIPISVVALLLLFHYWYWKLPIDIIYFEIIFQSACVWILARTYARS